MQGDRKIYQRWGDVFRMGGVVENWASTQALVALNVGEAEFYGEIKGAGERIGFCNLISDLGIEVRVTI